MEGSVKLRRVLVATRGTTARRLIRHYRAAGSETAAVFSEPDSELSYLDDADYPVFLGGRTVAETYLSPQRVVEAAMDAGVDAIHPGTCFLAEHLGFYSVANRANLAVIGADPRSLVQADRPRVRKLAREQGIHVLPGSETLAPGDDGITAAATIGFPLFVKSIRGRVLRRVDRIEDLRMALTTVRAEAALATGESGAWLERAVDGLRAIGVPVVGDRHGSMVALGPTEAVLQHRSAGGGFKTGLEEFGSDISGIEPGIEAASVAVARAIGWVGVGRVNWAVARSGGWFFQGFSGRLPTGFDLVEAVHGIDLLDAQFACLAGEPLGWDAENSQPARHGIQLRLLHLDLESGAQAPGTLERLTLPTGEAAVELGVDEGTALDAETDPLLAKITVVGDTRGEAVARAREALEQVEVAGVPTNLEALRRQLDDPFAA